MGLNSYESLAGLPKAIEKVQLNRTKALEKLQRNLTRRMEYLQLSQTKDTTIPTRGSEMCEDRYSALWRQECSRRQRAMLLDG